LKLAASKGHAKTVTLLLENFKPICEEDIACLYLAAAFGHMSAVDVLLNKVVELKEGPKPRPEAYIECRWRCMTALLWAALYGQSEVIKLLLNG
jgi:ankyrin repeat protein